MGCASSKPPPKVASPSKTYYSNEELNQCWISQDGLAYKRSCRQPPCPEGGMLLRIICEGLIPDMFGAFGPKEGTVFEAPAVGQVIESKSFNYKVGDRVSGRWPVQLYVAAQADGSDNSLKLPPHKLDTGEIPEKVVSTFDVSSGYTAALAINRAGVLTGKVSLVSACAGALGQIAGPVLKSKGCSKVIGICSERRKGDVVMANGGFDVIIHYKEEDVVARLKEVAPDGIDFFLDSVGGKQLSMIVALMKEKSKIIQLATISGQMEDSSQVQKKSLDVSFFNIFEEMDGVGAVTPELQKLVGAGALKTTETLINGFDKWNDAAELVKAGSAIGRVICVHNTQVASQHNQY